MKITKRLISLFLAALVVFGGVSVSALAASEPVYNKLIEANKATTVSLDEDETYIYGFKPEKSGYYALLSQSTVDVKVKTDNGTYRSGGKYADSNNFYTGSMWLSADKTYTFAVSAISGEACEFDLYLMYSPSVKVVSAPVKTDYVDGFEVNADGDTLTFSENIDFTGAVIEVYPLGSDMTVTVKDNDVLLFATEREYDSSKNICTVTLGDGLIFTAKVQLNVTEYPVKRINIREDADLLVYHFGKDGTVTGSAFKPVFVPDIKLEGMELEVQYKASESEVVPVLLNEKTGTYYIETKFGKLTVDTSCECEEAGTCEVTAQIAKEEISFDIEIEKATFFERVVLFFKMLFASL